MLLLLLAVAGCGAFDAKVSGVVTLDGAPLPGSAIAFHPVSAGAPATGVTDSEGNYSLHTGREVGLNAGEYIATVVALEAPTEEYGKGGAPPPPGKFITPPKYQRRETSGLTFRVEKGRNTIDIPLVSKP